MSVVTPAQVEQKLVALSREYDDAYQALYEAEFRYGQAKPAYEVKVAKSRMAAQARALESGRKLTSQEKDDLSLIECELEYTELFAAEAVVRAARANAQRLRTQIDIARSIGTSVRAALDL